MGKLGFFRISKEGNKLPAAVGYDGMTGPPKKNISLKKTEAQEVKFQNPMSLLGFLLPT